ncbi:MAG: hypothetical protein ACM3QZ_04235 [Solirubrobacterales bacterium]
MSRRRAIYLLSLVCFLLGLMISIQIRSTIQTSQNLSPDRWADLAVEIDYLRTQHDVLTAESITLRNKLPKMVINSMRTSKYHRIGG